MNKYIVEFLNPKVFGVENSFLIRISCEDFSSLQRIINNYLELKRRNVVNDITSHLHDIGVEFEFISPDLVVLYN